MADPAKTGRDMSEIKLASRSVFKGNLPHVPLAEALSWVRDGHITEAKAVTGLLWADKILRGEW